MIVVTGANGFVGSALVERLRADGRAVRPATRSGGAADGVVVGDIDADTDWAAALAGADAVVHLAARVHMMRDTATDPLAEFRKVNTDATINLARQAARAGVRRFVFVSSIKVSGESTTGRGPFTPDEPPAPVDPYGVSKLEAEQALLQLAGETGLEVAIVRPPLVYGPGVKANFDAMMRWLRRGIPLPLGAIRNRRTLVALDNLVDLIVACIDHPAAAGQVFLAGDAQDLSTSELLRRLAIALGTRARLVPIPAALLEFAAAMLGKRSVAQRLCGDLRVDISKARRLLGWTPPLDTDEGLRRAAAPLLRDRAR